MFEAQKIKQIYEATDIVSLIGETVSFKKRDSLLFGLCPFHKEKTASFSVNEKSKTYHCYGCGAGGNAYSFVMQRDHCSFEDAVSKLAKRAGLQVPENIKDDVYEAKKARIYQINELACSFFVNKGKEDALAMDYLRHRRELTDETIERFCLGKAGGFGQELYQHLKMVGYEDDEIMRSGLIGYGDIYTGPDKKEKNYYDKFWDRIMFPIFDAQENVVGFGGRVIGDGKPKYLNSPETIVFDKSHELYGLHIAKTQGKPFVLCEGYLDVISMHQAGFHTAVASLGTSLTVAQARMIASYTNSVFIAYDSDDAGIKATHRAVSILEEIGLRVFVVSTAPYKDVDELLRTDDSNASKMKERIKEALPGKTFLAKQLDQTKESFYEKMTEFII